MFNCIRFLFQINQQKRDEIMKKRIRILPLYHKYRNKNVYITKNRNYPY